MIHLVLSHGSSDGNPFDYLLHSKRSVPARLLRGDVQATLALIQASDFRQRYTSIVLSFEKDVSEEIQDEIIDSYEVTAFAGSTPEDFARVWVRHQDKGRTELHCVVANVHLPTGKRWAHYYHYAQQNLFRTWQELINLKYGLASPYAPERSRLRNLPGKIPAKKKEIFNYLDNKICAAIESGDAETRDDIVKLIQREAFEAAPKKQYICVRPVGSDDSFIRLKGIKYREGFDYNIYKQELRDRKTSLNSSAACEAELCAEYKNYLARRIAYVEKRFNKPEESVQKVELPAYSEHLNHVSMQHEQKSISTGNIRTAGISDNRRTHSATNAGSGVGENVRGATLFSSFQRKLLWIKSKFAVRQRSRRREVEPKMGLGASASFLQSFTTWQERFLVKFCRNRRSNGGSPRIQTKDRERQGAPSQKSFEVDSKW